MDTELRSRRLPDGRFELRLGKCVPVVIRSETFFTRSQEELYCLTGLLTLMADYFNERLDDCALPIKTGTFTETKTEFVLAEPAGEGFYDKLRVPRAAAFGPCV
jgi:hypothetical protein